MMSMFPFRFDVLLIQVIDWKDFILWNAWTCDCLGFFILFVSCV
jgi:hypothetical protein